MATLAEVSNIVAIFTTPLLPTGSIPSKKAAGAVLFRALPLRADLDSAFLGKQGDRRGFLTRPGLPRIRLPVAMFPRESPQGFCVLLLGRKVNREKGELGRGVAGLRGPRYYLLFCL